ncbi:MAG: OmpP1/FadL family transporter [Parachlamydiaceae bacterium]
MMRLVLLLLMLCETTYGELVGGRLNSFSDGQNAFAGVINPANAVWLQDRFDLGVYFAHQKSTLNNKDNNPFYPPGKIDLTYRSKNVITGDFAIHKRGEICLGKDSYGGSISLAYYSTPSFVKLRTKEPIPGAGTTPLTIRKKTNAFSAAFSLKVASNHSVGVAIDYIQFSQLREGFQRSDTPLRSVAPGHVTNNGYDHSHGWGLSLGWHWNITEKLHFGAAWARKSYCGRFSKYRGFDPHHAKNYAPQLVGAGFSYRFTTRIAGRLEMLWTNLGNLPAANNNVLPNGQINTNKRGSRKSPGPGVQDATFVNIGLGYKINDEISVGAGYSHRIKLRRKSPWIISRTYLNQTIYDVLSLGVNYQYQNHDLFAGATCGLKNRTHGVLPDRLGGGRFASEKETASLSISWGYLY